MLESLSSVRSRLPILKTLRIELWEHSAASPMDLFAHAPRLRDFIAGEHVTEKLLTIPWNRLQHFNINRSTNRPQQVLNLLALASNVERAQFRVSTSHIVWPNTEAPGSVQLRNLRSLIMVAHGLDPVPFMVILHMPKIRELSLAINMPVESRRPLWAFLSSHGTLEKLALYWGDAFAQMDRYIPYAPNAVRVLDDVKQLRVLELPQSEPALISADFLERFALLDQSGTPILGPNLQILLFHYSYHINYQSFARTLQSRFPPGGEVTLKTVTILCPQRDLVSKLKTFQKSVWWDQIRDLGINMQLQASESYAVWW
ncbi:hypothetical protein FIBSPDRAFT_1055920 [Athelia psychrophila]|uniref:F-box domain-containing protein n=1 Tax=Athelia psychrophila TaxID=1759441 RepID=A0A167SYN1_9AGAM|nr:hypothetical protein FIBSPDRAFT_1055920 [Fibularhizoctonia sp. CBS 109695]